MNVLSITPLDKEEKQKNLKKRGKLTALLFMICCFLPILVLSLFALGILEVDTPFPHLEQPVALVNTGTATGTAFLVGETRLITAKHVVDHLQVNDSVQLTFEKASPMISANARLIWKEPSNSPEPQKFLYDVAVLELENANDIPPDFPRLVIGDSEFTSIRDEVILIGYPGELFSITSGRISNDNVKTLDLFQLDVSSWPGSSGGPLILEATEEVIGVLVAGLSEDYQGINFANKINNVKNLLQSNGVDILK